MPIYKEVRGAMEGGKEKYICRRKRWRSMERWGRSRGTERWEGDGEVWRDGVDLEVRRDGGDGEA